MWGNHRRNISELPVIKKDPLTRAQALAIRMFKSLSVIQYPRQKGCFVLAQI